MDNTAACAFTVFLPFSFLCQYTESCMLASNVYINACRTGQDMYRSVHSLKVECLQNLNVILS